MKHEVTSLQTKKLLAGALKTCMETKPLSKVTVNELIGVCGLNRNTFYYHFNDIYALLEWMLRQETVEVLSHFELLTDYEEAILYVLDYIEKNKHILSCAYDAVGQAGLKRFFFNDCYQIVENAVADLEKALHLRVPEEFRGFLSSFYTEAMAGMLLEKATGKIAYSNQTLVDYLDVILKSTIPQALIVADEKRRASERTEQ